MTQTTSPQTATTIDLDVCTPEGKTWLAQITGVGGRYGLDRQFVNATERNVSRSGATGTYTYAVTDGVYESNEGRRRYGRRFWIIADGTITEVDQTDAIAALTAPATVEHTTRSAAVTLGVSVRTIQRRARQGKLTARKDARGRWIITL